MPFHLQSLLDLQRDAEKAASAALEVALAARVAEDEEHARLVSRWQAASVVLEEEKAHRGNTPDTAAQALMREHYRVRLDDDVARAARRMEEHRTSALAATIAAEEQARRAYAGARLALDATLKLKQRADAEDAKLAERRSEDEAGDHANAAFVRRRAK
jgi:hypothetical protein